MRVPMFAFMFVLLTALSACGGYAARLDDARISAQSGYTEQALASVDELVIRAREGRSPEDRDLPLLLLERASILQALGRSQEAAADLTEADSLLEVLDLSPDRAGKAAEYLFNASRALYRPPVYEKLMVNVMALSAFLDQGQIRDAMVEARRIGVLLDYFADTGLNDHPMLGAAAFLAGITMERGGERGDALRYYLEAWRSIDAPGLAEAVVRLGHRSPVAPDDEVQRARDALGIGPNVVPTVPAQELVTITFSGLGPYRVPERLPVGIVFAYMRQNVAYSLGETQQSAYNRILAEGLLTWVNFPSLVVQDNRHAGVAVYVDGANQRVTQVADVESFALAEWQHDQPGIAFSAITRAIVRVVAREAVQASAAATGNETARAVGFVAGLITQGAMQAADTPDTRVWSLMPAYVWVSRTPVQPGEHRVQVSSSVRRTEAVVNVIEGRTAFVVRRLF